MLRTSLVSPACMIPLLISELISACPIVAEPTAEALIDVGLSSIRSPLSLQIYGREEPWCNASLELPLSTLPSHSVVPRPRELAAELAPVAKVFGVKSCWITVLVNDDASSDADRSECYEGTFRFDGASWSTMEDDKPCW